MMWRKKSSQSSLPVKSPLGKSTTKTIMERAPLAVGVVLAGVLLYFIFLSVKKPEELQEIVGVDPSKIKVEDVENSAAALSPPGQTLAMAGSDAKGSGEMTMDPDSMNIIIACSLRVRPDVMERRSAEICRLYCLRNDTER